MISSFPNLDPELMRNSYISVILNEKVNPSEYGISLKEIDKYNERFSFQTRSKMSFGETMENGGCSKSKHRSML